MQRAIDAFSEEHAVDVAVALKQLRARDLLQRPVHLLRRSGRRAVDAEHPDIELALRLPFLKNVEHVAIAAGNAESGEARAVHVFDQSRAAGFQLVRRNLGKLARYRARGRNIALDHARWFACGVANDPALFEVRWIGCVGFDLQNVQRPAVQKDLIVGFLQRYRIIRRDLVQFLARERFRIVRELLMRPAADVVDPFARPRRFRACPQHLDCLFARLHAVEARLAASRSTPRAAGACGYRSARESPCGPADRFGACSARQVGRSPGLCQ